MRAAALVLLLFGCQPMAELRPGPRVQPSETEAARWQVFLNRVRAGVYRAYQPSCFDTVRAGEIVDFFNMSPEVPTNVTSIAGPKTLYSPNLVRPYNYVGPDDPANEFCDHVEGGVCVEHPAYSHWRFRFDTPGVYDWLDTNQGSPGRKVVDAYYGTETFIGIDPETPLGTICVTDAGGGGCEAVCCATDQECTGGRVCRKSAVDARGRCQTPSG